ncbi:YiiG family protein [Paenibacillus tianjinensis]|uniref:YiiG family protein n=1 Tax=Paenibacillus tianjinensis TaxID=2810347 RepID=A0ABX7LH91_9BACL|nr:YiiG family protein [Paenibacillus tianjinensis]QSF46289.1 YiiG family protein [Paenibacillus tianjinensis]
MRTLKFVIAVILLGVMLSACSATSSTVNQGPAGVTSGERKEIEKYNAYVMLNNLMTGRINEVLVHYFEKFGVDTQPVIEKNLSFIMLDVAETEREVIDKANSYTSNQPAFANADPLVTKLTPVIKDLLSVLDDMKAYYDSKGYVDDDFAKGKQLHTRLVNANLAYETIATQYFTALQKLGNEQRQAELQKLKDADQQIRYNALKFMIDAEATAIEMDEQRITAGNVLQLDMTKFKAKYDVMTADLNALMTISKDKERIQKEGVNSFSIGNYVDAATEAKAAASKIIERINKKEPVSDSDLNGQFLHTTDGTPENFNYLLSKAIERYNEMN